MIVEVKVPEVGESVVEGFLSSWEVADGAVVQPEDSLFELETDKVTVNVAAEEGGRIEILIGEGQTVEVGQAVARIDTDAQGQPAAAAAAPQAEAKAPRAEAEPAPAPQPVSSSGDPAPAAALSQTAPEAHEPAGPMHLPPSKRRLMREGKLSSESDSPAPAAPPAVQPVASQASAVVGPRQVREKMSPIRKRIAERLVESQRTAAILTTFNEVDMSRVMQWRARHKEAFKEKHGVGLGFMSFFVKATVEALKSVPEVNRQIEGDEIIRNEYYDIGVAVSSEKGLVVPVVRDADKLNFAQIEAAIVELARKVRERSIAISDLEGGVFTISNGGIFGSLLSTPILNPPQSGVLGMHGIKKRPVAVGDAIELRPMMYLALSYDHRLVDGREAVTFLKRIVECLEDPERMVLDL